jgi:hypothetical protein
MVVEDQQITPGDAKVQSIVKTADSVDMGSRNETADSTVTTALQSSKNTPQNKDSNKRQPVAAQNFLRIGATKAKELKSARTAARVGIVPTKKIKLSHTGSNIPLSQVIRLKFVKGFTQAVRAPCKIDDLM